MQYQLLTQDAYTSREANANEVRQIAIVTVELLVYLCASILFLVWVYRVNVNVRVMGGGGFEDFSWMVSWFFLYPNF